MTGDLSLGEISIRTDLRSGDIGFIIHLHGSLYKREYDYGIGFVVYVAEGLCEFYRRYDPKTNRVWICQHGGRIVGTLLLMNRGDAAQLRYFLIEPEYRGIGLGARLMNLYMNFLKESGYRRFYLWTTHELTAAPSLYKRAGFQLT